MSMRTHKNFHANQVHKKKNTGRQKLTSRQEELREILSCFHLWFQWFDTHFCSLTEREKLVITSYLKSNETREVAQAIRASPATVHALYKRAVSRLRCSGQDYYLWLIHQYIIQSRGI